MCGIRDISIVVVPFSWSDGGWTSCLLLCLGKWIRSESLLGRKGTMTASGRQAALTLANLTPSVSSSTGSHLIGESLVAVVGSSLCLE